MLKPAGSAASPAAGFMTIAARRRFRRGNFFPTSPAGRSAERMRGDEGVLRQTLDSRESPSSALRAPSPRWGEEGEHHFTQEFGFTSVAALISALASSLSHAAGPFIDE